MKKLLVLALLIPGFARAQTVAIKSVELAGAKVVVIYDLEDANPNNEYMLNLYSSSDNFNVPLKKVKGDIGTEVKPGIDKKIEWNLMEEYGNYKGRFSLELRGKAFVPFVKIKDFDFSKTYKRGNDLNLNWKPGAASLINIELFKGNNRVKSETNLANNGSYTLTIPPRAKPGKDYQLKIIDAKNSDAIYTSPFTVKRKVPLVYKALAVLVVGGVVYKLTRTKTIPDPPFPSGN